MIIDSVHISGYRSIDILDISFSRLTPIIGANNAGKSTIASAIDVFFDPAPKNH